MQFRKVILLTILNFLASFKVEVNIWKIFIETLSLFDLKI